MEIKDQIYLNMAFECAKLSKDENTKVGSVIVDVDGRVVSTGRNGTVAGFPDGDIPHSRDEKTISHKENGEIVEFSTNKYRFMLHSEANCLMFSDRSRLKGSTIYVTGMPCPNCALLIAQSKIGRVVIPGEGANSIKSITEQDRLVTKHIFANAGIRFTVGDEEIKLEKE